jgi:RNA polymerase sigma factor (sigma-70 family)
MEPMIAGFAGAFGARQCPGPCVVPLPLRLLEGRMANNDWGELMSAAQAGNAAVYHRLLLEISAWLRRYYARRLPPSMIADAIQETLLAIHEKRHTYDSSRPFGPWIAAIARYKWIDRLRAMESAPTETLSEDTPVADHEEAVSSARSLEILLGQLKPAQSNVIRLVKIEGLSIEEAAARTGQTISLVKVNIHRGLRRLASMVQRKSDVE